VQVGSTAPAVVEAQSRLAALYPDYLITRMPPAVLDGCAPMVANAAVYGDAFQWHIDMDPALAPPSQWTALHGTHPNRGRADLSSAHACTFSDAATTLAKAARRLMYSAKQIERCGGGVRDQGSDEAFMG